MGKKKKFLVGEEALECIIHSRKSVQDRHSKGQDYPRFKDFPGRILRSIMEASLPIIIEDELDDDVPAIQFKKEFGACFINSDDCQNVNSKSNKCKPTSSAFDGFAESFPGPWGDPGASLRLS